MVNDYLLNDLGNKGDFLFLLKNGEPTLNFHSQRNKSTKLRLITPSSHNPPSLSEVASRHSGRVGEWRKR
jgi:hypothetical protein